jgi:dTDP-4-amino-4,6-dideoxygalactose transaminase
MRVLVGAKYAVFVSSGSTANQLIAQYVKDKLIEKGEWPQRNKVVVSAVTWQTNVSVWVREGFEPVFLDVSLNDFCLEIRKLNKVLEEDGDKIAAVFPTTVLGYTPDMTALKKLELKYPKVKFALDACENTMGRCQIEIFQPYQRYPAHICQPFTSSTSCFLAHQINTGTEGGFIFTESLEEYIYYIRSRAHGLNRNLKPYQELLPDKYEPDFNPLVDAQFDFQTLSSNYRSSDVAAFCGLLDLKKYQANLDKRVTLYNLFYDNIDHNKYFLPKPTRNKNQDVAFCLPIIVQNNHVGRINAVKKLLDSEKVERRGFISGNMLRQKPYQKYADYRTFRNAEYLNEFALYIGLPMNLKEEQIIDLCKKLNKL